MSKASYLIALLGVQLGLLGALLMGCCCGDMPPPSPQQSENRQPVEYCPTEQGMELGQLAASGYFRLTREDMTKLCTRDCWDGGYLSGEKGPRYDACAESL